MTKERMSLNLKLVATVDFRSGIPHHYDELRKKRQLTDVGDDEVILLISQTGLQLAFVFREIQIDSRSGEPVKAIGHYRLQLSRHTPWSPLMLSAYADQAGIKLNGVKRFEDFVRDKAS